MVLLRFFSSTIFCQICVFLLILLLLCGATYLSTNLIFHAQTKHVEVDYHFVRDRVAKKEIQIPFISSKDQLHDVLTKPLCHSIFAFLRSKLHVENSPSASGGVLS